MTDDLILQLRSLIDSRHPQSRLEPLSEVEVRQLEESHPDIPGHLLSFYRHIGCGSIGRGRYMIHFATYADDIYDDKTASALGKILVVGDNFSGDCDGYSVDQNWSFGSIDSSGDFVVAEDSHPTIVHWLLSLLSD